MSSAGLNLLAIMLQQQFLAQVGKGYLYLSRVYQLRANSAPEYYPKAQQALTHAYEICYAGQVTPKAPGSTA